MLVDAGADVDACDVAGYPPVFYAAQQACLETVQILGNAGCVLYSEIGQSLLEYVIHLLDYPSEGDDNTNAALVEHVIRLVAERRQKLTAMARAVLDSQDLARLQLSPQTVLDSKAPLAISLLQSKVDIPRSLLSHVQCCVYHIERLHPPQAQSLWNAGFHDIDEFDRLGQTPLMKDRRSMVVETSKPREQLRERFIEWLLLKGADLHRQQGYACQQPTQPHGDFVPLQSCKTDRSSATTALHYLAAFWGKRL